MLRSSERMPASALLLLGLVALAPSASAGLLERGQRLSEALSALGKRGLHIIYSDRVVKDTMRIRQEPERTSPRDVLDEILEPHGLAVREGPAGALVVVRRPSVESTGRPPKPEVSPPPEPPPRTLRLGFEERVEVSSTLGRSGSTMETIEISPEEVSEVPGGTGNVFRALDLLPGIQTTSELSSRVSVRGGAPEDNLVSLDGVEIYNPFRLFGVTSVFHPSIVESFEVSRGGFDARHGDRLSSVLAVESRTGTRERWFEGMLDASLVDATMVLEGKLPGADGSWLLSGRGTYYDWLADRVFDANFPSFRDLHLKLFVEPASGHRVSLTHLSGREATAFRPNLLGNDGPPPEEDFGIDQDGRTSLTAINYRGTLGRSTLLTATLSRYRFEENVQFDGELYATSRASETDGELLRPLAFERNASVEDTALRVTLEGSLRTQRLESGFELHGLDTGWRYRLGSERSASRPIGGGLSFESMFFPGVSLPSKLDSRVQSRRWGAWVADDVDIAERTTLRAGLRVDGSTIHGKTDVSPRVQFTHVANRSLRAFGSVGLYHQAPGYEKLFLSDDFLDLSRAEVRATLDSERAFVVVAGLERDFGPTSFRIEGYAKKLSRLLVGRLESEAERLARAGRYAFPDALERDIPSAPRVTVEPVSEGSGRVLGIDLSFTKRAGRWTGALGYGLSLGRRNAYGVEAPLDYGRPHDGSGTFAYRVTPGITISLSGRIRSGLPRTPALGVRVAAIDDGSGALVPHVDEAGALVYTQDFGDVANSNSARYPVFSRFDLRFSHHTGGGTGRFLWYVEALNVFGQSNVLYVVPSIEFHDGSPVLHEEPLSSFSRLLSFGVRFEL